MNLSQSVVNLVKTASFVGFTGSRNGNPVTEIQSILAHVTGEVWVGDQRGVDSVVASQARKPRIFRVKERTSAGYALRSINFVSTLSKQDNPLLIGFPLTPCPAPLIPSNQSRLCFAGYGSGTWASLAYGIGLGIPTLIYTPTHPKTWELQPSEGNWYVSINTTKQEAL